MPMWKYVRDIKFRAWRHNQMIYDVTVGKVGDSYAQILLHWGAKTPNYPEFEGFDKTAILMQYINRKDKNGKEIYEGDILKYHERNHRDYFAKVEYQGTEFVAMAKDKTFKGCFMNLLVLDSIKVIGNIYENPELLPNI